MNDSEKTQSITAPLLAQIAHLEATASANYGRGHADAHSMLSEQIAALEAQLLEAKKDAERWRRLVNASELSFPVATIAVDPENDATFFYGRQRLERLIDDLDEIPNSYAIDAAIAQELRNTPISGGTSAA